MKLIFSIIMMLCLAGYSQAQTQLINIQTTGGFGNLHQYHDAITDVPGLTATIYLPQSASTGTMQLWFSDEVDPLTYSFYSYYIGTYNGSGSASLLQKCVFNGTNTCVPNGESLTVELNETSVRRQINSGRAHYWATHWTLVDGQILR